MSKLVLILFLWIISFFNLMLFKENPETPIDEFKLELSVFKIPSSLLIMSTLILDSL
tara:strand:+ start:3182 stop:3352 length:171 start_codon:yes stop_codon:yes gene_type:complete